MFNELVAAAYILQVGEGDLSSDGTKFSRRSGNTMGRGAITGRKNFARDYKSGGIRPKILEKVGQAVEEDERLF